MNAVYPKDIWHGGAIYPRIFCRGCQNWGWQISYDTENSSPFTRGWNSRLVKMVRFNVHGNVPMVNTC